MVRFFIFYVYHRWKKGLLIKSKGLKEDLPNIWEMNFLLSIDCIQQFCGG